jgi:hypothetical protein
VLQRKGTFTRNPFSILTLEDISEDVLLVDFEIIQQPIIHTAQQLSHHFVS